MLVKLEKFQELTGYTPKAVQRKIEKGHFRVGYEFEKAPDGNYLVNIEGYEAWAKSSRESKSEAPGYASRSTSTGRGIARL